MDSLNRRCSSPVCFTADPIEAPHPTPSTQNGISDRDFCPPNRLTLPVSFFLTFTVSGLLDLLNDGPIYKSQNVSNESCRAGRTGATQQEQDEQARHSRTQFRAVSGPSLSRCKQRPGKALRLIVAATTPAPRFPKEDGEAIVILRPKND